MEPDAVEIRVLGCLVEKQRTTPDAYPLTLNSLRLACNQATSREPVVEYDESTIRGGLDRLVRRQWATLASWSTKRTVKYRHTLKGALELSDAEISLLCVLMLRGPQTLAELKTRSERLHHFEAAEEVEATLRRLIERELARSLGKRPGQREGRFEQLLGSGPGEDEEPAAPAQPASGEWAPEPGPSPPQTAPTPAVDRDALSPRVEQLEREVAELRAALESLRDDLGA